MKCILHIGTEKTGTTMLQRWLYAHRAALSAHGVALTESAGKPKNRKLVAFLSKGMDDFHARRGLRTPDQIARFFDGFADEFLAELSALARDHHTVILTSEHMHSRLVHPDEIAALAQLLRPVCPEIRVICYLREQGRLRTSLYSTALKGGATATLAGFQPKITETDTRYNFAAMLGKWADVFGPAAIVPRVFERATLLQGDLRQDFLDASGLQAVAPDLAFDPASANEGFGMVQAEIVRRLNLHFAVPEAEKPFPTWTDFVAALLSSVGDTDRPLADPRQAPIHAMFDASNRDLAKRYLGRVGNPFPPPHPVDPTEAVLTETEARICATVVDLLTAWVGSTPLVRLAPSEVRILRDVADKAGAKGVLTPDEVQTLLRLAQRGDRSGPRIAPVRPAPSPPR